MLNLQDVLLLGDPSFQQQTGTYPVAGQTGMGWVINQQ